MRNKDIIKRMVGNLPILDNLLNDLMDLEDRVDQKGLREAAAVLEIAILDLRKLISADEVEAQDV